MSGLDHLVLGVRDLDAAASFYERLGFTVGARNRHPWGTHNRLVQLPGVFLEIITVGEPETIPEHAPGFFSFGAFVRDALARGEGVSMLALESADSRATNASWRDAGIGPYETFFFERQGLRPDGSAVRVAFTLAFARHAAAPEAGFFTCQQHEPQNFWNPAFQRHPNGASDIASVTFEAERPHDHAGFFAAFTGVSPEFEGENVLFRLPRGAIRLRRGTGSPRWTGFDVRVASVEALAERLRREGIGFSADGASLTLSPAQAFGAAIRFGPA